MNATPLPDTPQGMLELLRTRSIEQSPLTRWTGMQLLRAWNGEAELLIPFRDDLTQHRGTFHGGLLGIAADNVSGWAAGTLLGPAVTGSYTIHFLAPARGARLRAVGRVVSAGRRSAVVRADVHCENDGSSTLVATATATFVAVPAGPRPPRRTPQLSLWPRLRSLRPASRGCRP